VFEKDKLSKICVESAFLWKCIHAKGAKRILQFGAIIQGIHKLIIS
jgi:hypothetical protein